MTIKKRIVVWYTLWMGLLAILLMAAVVSASDILVRREAMSSTTSTSTTTGYTSRYSTVTAISWPGWMTTTSRP